MRRPASVADPAFATAGDCYHDLLDSRMRVGVLGGGLQGCCVALALAERGIDVVLFDRNQSLLSRTAVANEGKIHLGYMYVGDPTLATARTMTEGALSFGPFLQRYLGLSWEKIRISTPAHYAVHRSSQHSDEAVAAYLDDVHRHIVQASAGRERAYFGLDLLQPPQRWSSEECSATFNRQNVVAAISTPEISIDPEELAAALGACIAAHQKIEVRTEHHIVRAEPAKVGLHVISRHMKHEAAERFDHVVNALWDGRLAVDASLGLKPRRPWLHRLKYGIVFTLPEELDCPPSTTVVSGPFGEVVSYPGRQMYLTWYPVCLRGISAETAPPDWPTYPAEPLRSEILKRSIAALSEILPSLDPLNRASLADARVKGGVIVAWGRTDIDDPVSELHRRSEIGITSFGGYHSIDPGKLTMAPYYAERCANRIAELSRVTV